MMPPWYIDGEGERGNTGINQAGSGNYYFGYIYIYRIKSSDVDTRGTVTLFFHVPSRLHTVIIYPMDNIEL